MLKSKLGDRISVTKFSLCSASPPIVNDITALPYIRAGMKDRGVVLKVPLRLCLMDADSATVEISYGPVKVGLARLNIRGNLLIYVPAPFTIYATFACCVCMLLSLHNYVAYK